MLRGGLNLLTVIASMFTAVLFERVTVITSKFTAALFGRVTVFASRITAAFASLYCQHYLHAVDVLSCDHSQLRVL